VRILLAVLGLLATAIYLLGGEWAYTLLASAAFLGSFMYSIHDRDTP
jgi:hypothetical protein